MRALPLFALLAIAPCVANGAPVRDQAITITLTHYGLCGGDCADFDVTVQPGGTVVLRTNIHRKRNMRLTRFSVSTEQAARFRAALMPLRPVLPGRRLFCGGEEVRTGIHEMRRGSVTPEGDPIIDVFLPRVPILDVRWGRSESGYGLGVCLTPEDQPRIGAIEEALKAVELDLMWNGGWSVSPPPSPARPSTPRG